MSTIISNVHAALSLARHVHFLHAVRMLAVLSTVSALLVLFKPLLHGIARALVLLVKPRRSKEERQARHRMANVMMLNRILNSMDSCGVSHAAELRALASRA